MRLDAAEDEAVVSAQTPDFGAARERFKASSTESIVIGFNAKYLMDALNAVDGTRVRLEMKEKLSAALVKPVEGEDYLCVVMPMQIPD